MAIDNVEIVSVPPPSGPAARVFAADPLTFAKVSGPAWPSVATDGTLSGTPGASDLGDNGVVVSVSDGALSDNTNMVIGVYGAAQSASVFPAMAGHGQDGGANFGWVVDGVIDEFAQRTAYQDDVVVRRYTSLDFTKRSDYWGVVEFMLPQAIRDNAANVVVDAATLEFDVDGSASGAIYVHGYAGNGTPHPAYGHISGQISRMTIGYRAERSRPGTALVPGGESARRRRKLVIAAWKHDRLPSWQPARRDL